MGEGKIIGARAPGSKEVYAGSRGTDPTTGEPTSIEVEVADTGCITTFCIVNVPGLSELAPEIPYASAHILLDGADNTYLYVYEGDRLVEQVVRGKNGNQVSSDVYAYDGAGNMTQMVDGAELDLI